MRTTSESSRPGAISRPSCEGSWPSAATIFSRAVDEAGLRQVVAEQVDRGDQRLRLQRQQAGRAGEVVAVGVRVDLDLVADDLRVEHVGAAAEVDDVEHVDVLASSSRLTFSSSSTVADRQPGLLARGADQQPGEGDQAREALRAGSPTRARPFDRPRPAVALGDRPRDRLRDVELAAVALAQELQPLGGVLGARSCGLEQRRRSRASRAPRRSAGAPTRTRSRRSTPRPGDAVLLGRLAQLAVAAEVALDEPGDALADEHLRRPRRSRPSASRPARRSRGDRSPRAARSRARPWSRRRPCRGSARGGRRAPRRARASGRSNRTGRCGRRGGTGSTLRSDTSSRCIE